MDSDEQRRLFQATASGQLPEIRAILKANPSLLNQALNEYSRSALYVAAHRNHANIVSFLLSFPDIQVNQKSVYGMTPIIAAASKGCTEVVKLLLAHKDIDPNSQNDDGDTALHWAASQGLKEVTALLLAHPRTDATITNKKGRMAAERLCEFEGVERKESMGRQFQRWADRRAAPSLAKPTSPASPSSNPSSNPSSAKSPPPQQQMQPTPPPKPPRPNRPSLSQPTSPAAAPAPANLPADVTQRLQELLAQQAVLRQLAASENLAVLAELDPAALDFLARLGGHGREAERLAAEVAADPLLAACCGSFVRHLTGAALAAQCIASQLVADGREYTSEAVAGLFGQLLSASSLPGADLVAGLGCYLAAAVNEADRRRTVQRLAATFPGQSGLAWVELLGRALTVLRAEEIRQAVAEAEAEADRASSSLLRKAARAVDWLQEAGAVLPPAERLGRDWAGRLVGQIMRTDPAEAVDSLAALRRLLEWAVERPLEADELLVFGPPAPPALALPASPARPTTAEGSPNQAESGEAENESGAERQKRLSAELAELREKIHRLEAAAASASSPVAGEVAAADRPISVGGRVFLQRQAQAVAAGSSRTASSPGQQDGRLAERLAAMDWRLAEHAAAARERLEQLEAELDGLRERLAEAEPVSSGRGRSSNPSSPNPRSPPLDDRDDPAVLGRARPAPSAAGCGCLIS